jgi:hypothetical protein
MDIGYKRAVLIIGGFAIFFAFVCPVIETPIFVFKAKLVDAPTVALSSALQLLLASMLLRLAFALAPARDQERPVEILPLICSRLC